MPTLLPGAGAPFFLSLALLSIPPPLAGLFPPERQVASHVPALGFSFSPDFSKRWRQLYCGERNMGEAAVLCSLSLPLSLLLSQDPLPEYRPGMGGLRGQNQR